MRVRVLLTALLAFLILILSSQTSAQTRIQKDRVNKKPGKQNSNKTPSDKIKFKHITKDQGLSDSFDWCILQDRKGFIWIGTSDGLDRYDGLNFKVFKHSPYKANTVGANTIRSLYEDRSGMLWIATEGGGLNRYNSENESFTRFENDPNVSTTISSNVVTALFEDKSGNFWVGTRDGGLNLFDRFNSTFKCFKKNPYDHNSISSNTITAIYEDSKNNLWVGTAGGGLNKFDRSNNFSSRFLHNPMDAKSLSPMTYQVFLRINMETYGSRL